MLKGKLDEEAAEANRELLSLKARKNNIPARDLELRGRLCRELRLTEESLPFAGELIAVRAEEGDWEGAAERLLRSFALSVLVPDENYADVSEWINGHHLNGRIVYYRVPRAAAVATSPPDVGSGTLAAKLTVKDSPFAPWLERELARRADVECVETMAEFRRMTKAITKAGQVKGTSGRHEKDDRFRIDDRGRYVLGWSNERKIDALLSRATALAARITSADAELAGHTRARDTAFERGKVLAALEQTDEFAEIDYQSVVNEIAGLRAEHGRLKAASAALSELDERLAAVKQQIEDADKQRTAANEKLGGVDQSVSDAEAAQREVRAILAEPGCEAARAHFAAIGDLLRKAGHTPPVNPVACDKAETRPPPNLSIAANAVSARGG